MSKQSIGLIGVGLVGTVLARRLSATGFDVHAYDNKPHENQDVAWHASSLEVCQTSQVVLFSLPNSAIVAAVVDEILPSLTEAHTIIDTTTSAPEEALA